jgi:hypothetical protein
VPDGGYAWLVGSERAVTDERERKLQELREASRATIIDRIGIDAFREVPFPTGTGIGHDADGWPVFTDRGDLRPAEAASSVDSAVGTGTDRTSDQATRPTIATRAARPRWPTMPADPRVAGPFAAAASPPTGWQLNAPSRQQDRDIRRADAAPHALW